MYIHGFEGSEVGEGLDRLGRSPALTETFARVLPLKEPLLDPRWLLSSIHRFIDLSDLAAGLAGWLAWVLVERMMSSRGSKDFPHARRSGEVGGFFCRILVPFPGSCTPSAMHRIWCTRRLREAADRLADSIAPVIKARNHRKS